MLDRMTTSCLCGTNRSQVRRTSDLDGSQLAAFQEAGAVQPHLPLHALRMRAEDGEVCVRYLASRDHRL